MSREEILHDVSTKQDRIARIAANKKSESLMSIAHHVDLKWLYVAYLRTRKDGAVGIDGIDGKEYGENLRENLTSLLDRLKSGTYRAPAVKRVYIPKGTKGETRPLGIPTFEDKVLQRAIVMLLNPIFEQDFQECSFGFREGRSAHQALDYFWAKCMKMGGGWVIDLDIRRYFDTIDHKRLREVMRERVCDGVVTRIIDKWLKAGVMEDQQLTRAEEGTPQGGVISPLLSNVFLHHVIDVWFENEVRPRLKGKAFMVRYADDCLLFLKNKEDSERVMRVLPKRFAKWGLTIHPEKTNLVDFRNPDRWDNKDLRKSGTFSFLGFTHYWSKSRKGNYYVGRKTDKDRFTRSLKKVADWCRRYRHVKVKDQWMHLSRVLRGHYAYYGIYGNSKSIAAFGYLVRNVWKKWLSRRSRLRSLNWNQYKSLLNKYRLPPPRIHHPANLVNL